MGTMGQPRVLITDDDDTTLEMLEAALQAHYAVTTAHCGPAALEIARTRDFDLIVLDVDMPDMDGYATCKALKAEARTRDVPVLFLSAKVNIDERLRGYRVGGSDYLTKPFDVEELITKISLAVSQREHDRQLNSQIEQARQNALLTAHLYDEAGVVLGFQRKLRHCNNHVDMAQLFFAALARMGFEGCLRLSGRLGVTSRSGQGECSALGLSLLDHLESVGGTRIQAVGDNTSFNFGQVLILVRNLPLHPANSHHSAEEIERLTRVRDNIALMADGMLSRLQALDAAQEHNTFEHSLHLVSATRDALVDISAQQHANRMLLGDVLQQLNQEVETAYIHLGLSESQEEHLSTLIRRCINEAMSLFDQSNEIEAHLQKLIVRLNA
jgi:CheY-like chemotaxis protein